MDNFKIAQLKAGKYAFMKASALVTCMTKYSDYLDEKDRNNLDFFAQISEGLPLPSGRWGNAIALALEINNYVAAEYLIENSDRLGLDINTIVSEFGGKNPWSLKDEYLYSQLTNEVEIMPISDGQTKENYQEYVDSIIRNQLSNKRLGETLSITSEEIAELGIKK